MNIRIPCLALCAALIAGTAAGRIARAEEKAAPSEKAASANAARFEALKKLAGDWLMVGPDGKPTGTLASSIRVTAAGSAIQETLLPGTSQEMVTMYYLDGEDLVLTHYCALGNQPHMRAEPGKETNRIVFKCVGGGNLKTGKEMHMNQVTINLVDSDHWNTECVACQDGKPCHSATFQVVRKK